MNYIYDIVLNFQDNYYQFFEWNKTDKIKNISKLIVYRIQDHDLLNLTYNQIKLDNEFITNLKEANKKYKKLMCLVSNTKQTIGLLFSNDGYLLKRSSLLFEEENEVNYFAKELPLTKINYLQNDKILPNNKLRLEKEKKELLTNFIKTLTDEYTLKYLYYEYFKKECLDITNIKTQLLEIIEKDWNQEKNNLYQIINILTKKDLLTK